MSSVEDYLIGSIYHMVHFNNLQSIFAKDATFKRASHAEEASL